MPDVFISHATEDKEKVARPLAEALRKNGLDVWYDEFSLDVGDSLRESIDKGIRESRFGVVIFSKSFFGKKWPQKELNGLISREIHGRELIIPIWHEIESKDMENYSPTLADRVAIISSEGIEQMVNKIIKKVKPELLKTEIIGPIQPLVDIIANKNSFVIGKTISFAGNCRNSGDIVHLVIWGPGKYSKGFEIATPKVSRSEKWFFEWTPESTIEPGEYNVRVFDTTQKVSDEVQVRIEKGSILMVADGNLVYYIGEKVRISGICTSSYYIFLSIKPHGVFTKQTKIDQMDVLSKTDIPDTFTKVDVMGDNTWSFNWDTSLIASKLKPGYYSIYATESPKTFGDLGTSAFSIMSILIEQPFVSATVSHSTVAKGDFLYITGTAEGQPRKGIKIWIFGDDNYLLKSVPVNPDASYILRLTREDTKKLKPGQYFVVIQHPMINNEFDVYLDDETGNVCYNYPKKSTPIFSIKGPSSKKGIDAAMALIVAMNNQGIDDTYTKLQFLVETPVIRFDPINDKHIGDKFTITASTNLVVDDEVIFSFSSINSESKQLFKSIESGLSMKISVTKGDSGMNKLSFDIDTASFKPGKYLLKASAIDGTVITPLFFTILE